MLSHRLVDAIECHCDAIMAGVISQIRHDPALVHMGKLPDWELRDWGCTVLRHLGKWLAAGKDAALAKRYEDLGRIRFQESIPLREAVHAVHILKGKTVDYVRECGHARTAVDLYAEEELEYLVDHFFDWLVDHLVQGYEEAFRQAAHLAS